jgi:hypothetical protein
LAFHQQAIGKRNASSLLVSHIYKKNIEKIDNTGKSLVGGFFFFCWNL